MRARNRPEGERNSTHAVKVLGADAKLLVFGRRDERVAQIAAVQRGRVSRRQLLAAGISSAAVGRLTARGQLLPSHRGVFAVGHQAPVELADETAALLAVRDGAALNHHSAAMLWGIAPSGSGDRRIHVLVPGGSAKRLQGVCVHSSRILQRVDIRIRDGLPVTSPARTLLDLAETDSDRELERAFDEALVQRLVRLPEIAELLRRFHGRPGGPRLRALLEREGGPIRTRSQAEERFLALIRRAQLPEPEVNVRLHGYEVDFHWRAQRLVIEIDGFQFHSTRRAFEHDRRKDATLRAAGITTMRVTWRQMTDESYTVIARLAQALASFEEN